MSDLLNIFKQKLSLNSQISIIDNTQLLVENCKNVLEVNENLVRIYSSDFEIEVWGSNLSVSNYSCKAVKVNGKIITVEIKERGKKS